MERSLFIKTGGQILDSDDFFRAYEYQAAQEEHNIKVEAKRAENNF
jgi:hypothetical protein